MHIDLSVRRGLKHSRIQSCSCNPSPHLLPALQVKPGWPLNHHVHMLCIIASETGMSESIINTTARGSRWARVMDCCIHCALVVPTMRCS